MTRYYGTEQSDLFVVTLANSKYFGLGGDDFFFETPGSAVPYAFHGGPGYDEFHSLWGDAKLFGGLGNDLFYVGLGHDVSVAGGQGKDILYVPLDGTSISHDGDITIIHDKATGHEIHVKGVEHIYDWG